MFVLLWVDLIEMRRSEENKHAPSPCSGAGLLAAVAAGGKRRAHPAQLQIIIETSGELEQRTVLIDPDRRTVRDNAMTFTDSATSPLAKNIEEFVTVVGRRATSGVRTKLD